MSSPQARGTRGNGVNEPGGVAARPAQMRRRREGVSYRVPHRDGKETSLKRETRGTSAPAGLNLTEDPALDGERPGGVAQNGVGGDLDPARLEAVAAAGEGLGLSERWDRQEGCHREKVGARRRAQAPMAGLRKSSGENHGCLRVLLAPHEIFNLHEGSRFDS